MQSNGTNRKKKLTRGEKLLLAAPLFFGTLYKGIEWFRSETNDSTRPYVTIEHRHPSGVVWKSTDEILGATLSIDGKQAAVLWRINRTGCKIDIYSTVDGGLILSIPVGQIERNLGSVAFSPDGKWIACSGYHPVGSSNQFSTTSVWDITSGTKVVDLDQARQKLDPYYDGFVGCSGSVAFTPDSRGLLLSDSSDGDFESQSLRIWHFRKNGRLRTFLNTLKNHGVPFRNVHPRFLMHGQQLAYKRYVARPWADWSPRIQNQSDAVEIRDVKSGRIVKSIRSRQITAFAISPDEKKLVIAHRSLWAQDEEPTRLTAYTLNTEKKKWDIAAKGPQVNSQSPDDELSSIVDVVFAPDGKKLICQDIYNHITVRDAATGSTLVTLYSPGSEKHQSIAEMFWSLKKYAGSPTLSFSNNGKIMMSATSRRVFLWHTDDWLNLNSAF